jgi:hypothetical protein
MPPPDLDGLSNAELKALVGELLGRVAELTRTVVELREENARLKGLKGRPDIKPGAPSGMERASHAKPPSPPHRGGGNKTAKRVIHETRIVKASVPPGSRFKGYEDFVVQDLVLRPHVVRYRRERWVTPDGGTVIAPLPGGVSGHFGAEGWDPSHRKASQNARAVKLRQCSNGCKCRRIDDAAFLIDAAEQPIASSCEPKHLPAAARLPTIQLPLKRVIGRAPSVVKRDCIALRLQRNWRAIRLGLLQDIVEYVRSKRRVEFFGSRL